MPILSTRSTLRAKGGARPARLPSERCNKVVGNRPPQSDSEVAHRRARAVGILRLKRERSSKEYLLVAYSGNEKAIFSNFVDYVSRIGGREQILALVLIQCVGDLVVGRLLFCERIGRVHINFPVDNRFADFLGRHLITL